jgi:hypothetical protein
MCFVKILIFKNVYGAFEPFFPYAEGEVDDLAYFLLFDIWHIFLACCDRLAGSLALAIVRRS